MQQLAMTLNLYCFQFCVFISPEFYRLSREESAVRCESCYELSIKTDSICYTIACY
jgi:hypothetical protein